MTKNAASVPELNPIAQNALELIRGTLPQAPALLNALMELSLTQIVSASHVSKDALFAMAHSIQTAKAVPLVSSFLS